jgi:uncharacterized protein
MMNLSDKIAQLLAIKPNQVQATLDLLDADNTIPFIARYRKEMTGSLDEDQIAKIADQADKLRTLEKRRETILASIAEQGHLTPELQAQIENADSLTVLEDLYLPYKPKRRTRASIARENGLQSLADMILGQIRTKDTLDALATPFLSDNVPSVADAWAGARDIVAETISDNAQVRGDVREKALRYGIISSEKIPDATDEKAVFKIYYQFTARVSSIRAYQILALNRGEAEKILRVSIQLEERDWLRPIDNIYRIDHRSPLAEQLQLAQVDAGKRLLLPAIERDVRRTLTEIADAHAINVFAQNLRALLSQPPIPDRVVMGIDPGFRTGTKVAVVDSTGKVLATATIYPHEPQREWQKSLLMLSDLIKKYGVSLIAIGNGTASRETEALVAELTRGRADVHYVIVSEAGASVYSASPLARAELPDLDVTLRGAVSIARRIQDPLAELVKIDPKSIGVGLYQHDVDQKQLTATLEAVVERVVNAVGVDVNTASPALLRYVAGIGNKLAENIVAYRDANGKFPNRMALKKVSGLGAKAFEQSAGFLRIRESDNPLDASAIHPESYKIAQAVLKKAKLTPQSSLKDRESAIAQLRNTTSLTELAKELDAGVPTLSDILEQLVRPGRDPRADLPMPILRNDVLSMSDLQVGMTLNGTVRNVVDFGVFIDIGVKQDGLLHRSQWGERGDWQVGDIIKVEIVSIEPERGRIGLAIPQSMDTL